MNIFTRIVSNPTFKRFLLLLLLFTLFTIISAFSYATAISDSISNSLFRLHVVSNSPSSEDQHLKYLVRDNILQYINEHSDDFSCKDDILLFANNNIDEIQRIANNTLYSNGSAHSANVQVGNFRFPTKQYGEITLPPGFYDALKVEIGDAVGSNWWCVMFPPLCFVDISSGVVVPDSSRDFMKDNLSEEEYRLISHDSADIRVKFMVVEVFQNIWARI
ncbi:MAG: stage II sporulation protein R [Oscillospiraceae bacterium]|nr:stage II sporulation protein R [Oscillospiraceae bacterium]